jgi:hypothetical protein
MKLTNENFIQAIRCHIKYHDIDDPRSGAGILYEALRKSIKLLQLDIAEKPIREINPDQTYELLRCPNCCSLISAFDVNQPRCVVCGKKLDWGSIDDNN